MKSSTAQSVSPLPHALALLLVAVTFPLIWIGGLVTTYDAGMAVPDWPITYGYNLFLYPWQTWLSGPWDLLIEHGHRLWASLAGLVTIALVIAVWCYDNRRWARWLSLAALAGIVGQGVLGGMRVRMDDVLFARIHGCVRAGVFRPDRGAGRFHFGPLAIDDPPREISKASRCGVWPWRPWRWPICNWSSVRRCGTCRSLPPRAIFAPRPCFTYWSPWP